MYIFILYYSRYYLLKSVQNYGTTKGKKESTVVKKPQMTMHCATGSIMVTKGKIWFI